MSPLHEYEQMKFLKLKEVMSKTALGRSTIYNYISEERFPKSISLGARSVAWNEEEIDEWMLDRLQERDDQKACFSMQVKDWEYVFYIPSLMEFFQSSLITHIAVLFNYLDTDTQVKAMYLLSVQTFSTLLPPCN